MAFRFLIERSSISVQERIELTTEHSKKLLVVLRHAEGDSIELITPSGLAAEAVIVAARKGKRVVVEVTAIRSAESRRLFPLIRLFQAIPKPQKLDWIVEKTTEVGVDEIYWVISSRSFGHGSMEGRLSRLNRIAGEATQQCGRPAPPRLFPPLRIDAIAPPAINELRLLCSERAEESALLRLSLEKQIDAVRSVEAISLAIGPEGGFTDEEEAFLTKVGFLPVSLGDLVLRVETAGLVAIALLRHELRVNSMANPQGKPPGLVKQPCQLAE